MRRRITTTEEALTEAGVPLSLVRFRPEDWPPSTAEPDERGFACLESGPFHAGCRFWAAYRLWSEQHPEVQMPLIAPDVDAAWHDDF